MTWVSVENQHDLDGLDRANCWEDSRVIEIYASVANEEYFPTDISRSGWQNKNVHILVETCAAPGSHLEIVMIDCDHYSSDYFENLHFNGRVDSLKRIEISRYDGLLKMRCSRLIYRWLNLDGLPAVGYFRHPETGNIT